MMRWQLISAVTFAVAAVVVAASGVAHAKSQRVVRYTFEQVWPASLRFLRVDEGFEIIERDAEAGYILFAVNEENKRFRGALELVRIEDDGWPALRLIIRIDDRPAYMELGILQRLERKLREEVGDPPERPPRPKPKPEPADPDKPKGDTR